ncbi:MAG: LURP-one-related/scramblase family protein [Eubacteriales bacterium]
MQLLIKQRVFSWRDRYDVYDQSGSPKYEVRSEIFTFGHQIHVYGMDGREVGSIHQKFFRLLPAFEVVIDGLTAGCVQKRFALFRPVYDIDFRGWSAEGNLFGWNYDVTDGRRTVMHITKELFRWGDTYVLNFSDPDDEIPGLLLVIAIDAANCDND